MTTPKELLENMTKPFTDSLEKESDRAVAIITGCLLDDMLERLLRSFFIRDTKVKSLFKNDHLLQTTHAKINVAYFSGLIPRIAYHDSIIINNIRNIFAHEMTSNLSFDSKVIAQKIRLCELKPKILDQADSPKFQFVFIVQYVIWLIGVYEIFLKHKDRPLHLTDIFKIDEREYDRWTKLETNNVIRKHEEFTTNDK